MPVGDTYHVDHVVPLVRGGSDDPSNLVIACVPCNLSKGDKLPHEWKRSGRLL
jgi:5-methylcytosine-specific restriction endonuclease McrA